jgi:hypothetical protein
MGIGARRRVMLEPLLLDCNDPATIIVTEFYCPWCSGGLNGGEICSGIKTGKLETKCVQNSFYKTMNFD